jgi:hypothetical protein
MARMSYRFSRVDGGTLYENELVVGARGRLGAVNFISPVLFPEAKGQAWIVHNVEEVGSFEQFLPTLYDDEAGRAT